MRRLGATMRVLFLGGTGIISTACTRLALERGFDVTVLNRGQRVPIPGTRQMTGDVNAPTSLSATIGDGHWDVVADFVTFAPEQVEQRLALFRGRVGQYLYISSASAYQKPVTHYLVTESTPLVNPFWDYSRAKIACEERLTRALRDESFPVTIVRPSFTYGETVIPLPMSSWLKQYTVIERMRRGAPVVIPGDGTSLWTLTHNTDFAKGFVGLFGHQAAVGHAFHITSDEVLTWNQAYEAVAEAAGVAKPNFVHIASDFIAPCLPDAVGGLHGDKINSVVFDNTKIKRFVPEFVATTRFRDGIRRSLAWFDADPARQVIDHEANQEWDRLVAAYQRGLTAAVRELRAR